MGKRVILYYIQLNHVQNIVIKNEDRARCTYILYLWILFILLCFYFNSYVHLYYWTTGLLFWKITTVDIKEQQITFCPFVCFQVFSFLNANYSGMWHKQNIFFLLFHSCHFGVHSKPSTYLTSLWYSIDCCITVCK